MNALYAKMIKARKERKLGLAREYAEHVQRKLKKGAEPPPGISREEARHEAAETVAEYLLNKSV